MDILEPTADCCSCNGRISQAQLLILSITLPLLAMETLSFPALSHTETRTQTSALLICQFLPVDGGTDGGKRERRNGNRSRIRPDNLEPPSRSASRGCSAGGSVGGSLPYRIHLRRQPTLRPGVAAVASLPLTCRAPGEADRSVEAVSSSRPGRSQSLRAGRRRAGARRSGPHSSSTVVQR
ncbi:unnamed protein product [Boreogadus saida]